jgi:SHS2 domain-containing protein
VEAASWEALLIEAGRGIAELELRGAPAGTGAEWRDIDVAGADREAVLVNWLNELVYLAEAEHWVATEFEPMTATGKRWVVRARGAIVSRLSGVIKAVTHHRVSVRAIPGGLVAEVVIDV